MRFSVNTGLHTVIKNVSGMSGLYFTEATKDLWSYILLSPTSVYLFQTLYLQRDHEITVAAHSAPNSANTPTTHSMKDIDKYKKNQWDFGGCFAPQMLVSEAAACCWVAILGDSKS